MRLKRVEYKFTNEIEHEVYEEIAKNTKQNLYFEDNTLDKRNSDDKYNRNH